MAGEKQSEMSAGVVAEFHARISALEESNADLRNQLEASRNAGTSEPYDGFGPHVVHVMKKHFFHDRPDADDASRQGGG